MKRVALLLLILVAAPAHAEGGFDAALAARVFGAALDFVAPRSLDPTSVPELARWGLGGLSALDPALSAHVGERAITLTGPGGPIATEPLPTGITGAAWGEAVARLAAAAFAVSEPVRQAGTQGVLQSFFDEMFNHLDVYSRYVAPVAAEMDRARRSGNAGAGLTLERDRYGILIRSVNADGAGAAAGVSAGERLLAVDGRTTRGQTPDTVESWTTGDEGTAVRLTVRDRHGRIRTIDIERAITPPETVFARRLGDDLVLRVSSFAEDTDIRIGMELARAMQARFPVHGLILDLRNNRGGLLRQSVTASELMLGGGVVATTAGRDPQASHVWAAPGTDMLEGRPIVVLVDGRSASAAEIMAAALADRGRAVVVGSVTYGKGLVQVVTTLPDGGELFVSWSRVLAPLGWPLQGLGVMPQVCTSLGGETLRTQLDALMSGQDELAVALANTRNARPPVPQARAVELRTPCPAAIGREADLDTARFLLTHPAAYAAALLPHAMLRGP